MARRGALVYLPAALVVAVEALVLWPLPWHIGDWFQFWYAGHILAEGKSPLDPAAWRDAVYTYPLVVDDFVTNVRRAELFTDPETPILIPPWIYPPWTAAAFVPFGVLPIRLGVVLIHVVLLVGGLAGLIWLVSRLRLPAPVHAFALALAVGVQPFVLATRTGHFTAILLVGALLTLVALERRSTAALVAGAAILSLKPHLFAVFAIVVLAVLIRRRDRRAIAITSGAMVALAGLFYLRYPPPVGGTLDAVVHRITTDDSSTTWALAEQLAPGVGPIAGALVVAAAAVVAWWTVRAAPERLRTFTLVAVSLAVSLAVSPYVHTYDHVLLLPALAGSVALVAEQRGPVRLAVGAAVIAGGLVYPWFAYFSDVQGRQWPSGGVPYVALALIAASVLIASRRWPRLPRPAQRPSPA